MAPFKTFEKQSLKPLVDDGFFNLFNGLAITSTKGEWKLIRQHVLDVICDGREEVYEFLMNLWAFMFQKPNERSGVIVVMVSESGTGKNVVMQPIVDALRPHSYMADSPERICGKFNDQLGDKLLVVANEAVFGAKYADKLKSLATEPTLQIERKGIPSIEVNNCVNLVVLTNNKKAVPMDFFDRRMFFVDVSNKYAERRLASVEYKATRTAYFEDLIREINNGGREAFIDHLLHRDIKEFKPSNMPAVASESRIESKTMRTNSVQKWWFSCLVEPEIMVNRDLRGNMDYINIVVEDWDLMSLKIPRKPGCGLYDSYLLACKVQGVKPDEKSSFGKQLESFGIKGSGNQKIQSERYYMVPRLCKARDIFANDVYHETTESLFPEDDPEPFDLGKQTGPLYEAIKRKKGKLL